MHEMSLVHDLLEVVLSESAKSGITQVKTVYLTIGEARDIVVELFEGLFRHLAKGTIASNASIIINHVPLTMRCRSCGHVFSLNVYDESTWVCPNCGATKNYTTNTGLEFSIDRIEGAVVETYV